MSRWSFSINDGPAPSPRSTPITFGRPSRFATNSTANPIPRKYSATTKAAPSSRAGGSSGSSGFSHSGCPAGISAHASAIHPSSVTCDSTRASAAENSLTPA